MSQIKLYGLKEAADYLGLTLCHLNYLIKRGNAPCYTRLGDGPKSVFAFAEPDLQTWMEGKGSAILNIVRINREIKEKTKDMPNKERLAARRKMLTENRICARCGYSMVNEDPIYCDSCKRSIIMGSNASADGASRGGA